MHRRNLVLAVGRGRWRRRMVLRLLAAGERLNLRFLGTGAFEFHWGFTNKRKRPSFVVYDAWMLVSIFYNQKQTLA